MAEILEPRAEEIFTLLQEEIQRAGFHKLLNAGWSSRWRKPAARMIEVAEQVFDLPVRRGVPREIGGLAESADPQAVTAIGLALHGARNRSVRRARTLPPDAGILVRMGDRVSIGSRRCSRRELGEGTEARQGWPRGVAVPPRGRRLGGRE